MKMLSLFSGSGGFELAGRLCGITPVAAAEIEPYPIAVTRKNFPGMKHLGDVRKIKGDEIEPVDVMTFGSPCQDLSIAGKRAGLKHVENGDDETSRSGLFMEAIRIIREMREVTNGKYPRYVVWENVFGAFSSNKGEDFRTVLQKIIGIAEKDATVPSVPKNGWAYADCYRGDGWSVAYRLLDAQFWGVPQRRRRIYLVADFRGDCAEKILFEREGLRGDYSAGGATWEKTTANTENGTRANDVFAVENHPADSRVNIDSSGKVQCLTGRMGTGGGNVPMVVCLQANGIDRADTAGCNGKGWKENISYTLNTIDRHAVAYNQLAYDEFKENDVASTIKALGGNYGGGSENMVVEYSHIVRRLTPTECARLQGFPDEWGKLEKKTELTDEEYSFWLDVRNNYAGINGKKEKDYKKEQMVAWYNKLHSDRSEYEMWGNGIALPCALYVMEGIAMNGVMK